MLKGDYAESCKEKSHRKLFLTPCAFDSDWPILPLLPQSSDVGGSRSRVATHEVARSDSAGDVGALREMLALITGCEDAAVTAGGWSTPSGYLAALGDYGQCPAGVDEFDSPPADLVLPKDIDDFDSIFTNLDSRKPKEQRGYAANQADSGEGDKCGCESFSNENDQPGECHGDYARQSYRSARSRPEYLHAKSLACMREVLS